MIFILESEKDTYVTNFKNQNNKGELSNVGQAATIDLLKLYNENKNAFSWAVIEFTGQVAANKTLKITDSLQNSKTFKFVSAEEEQNAINAGFIPIVGNTGNNEASLIKSKIDADSSFDINASITSSNILVLKQNKSGESGDTDIVYDSSFINLKNSYVNKSGENVRKFARIDYSAALIYFDLASFKSKWINTNDDGEVNGQSNLSGSFSSLKAELILKDVTTGIVKPKDYEVSLYKLKKGFNEGIGKDTIYFSDRGICNFVSLNESQDWEVSSFITDLDAEVISTSSNVSIEKGEENIKFDISDYIIDEFKNDTSTNKGFLFTFSESNLYDNKSYFAKRLGSRHLKNKKLVPELRIKIDDSSSHIPVNSFNKQRFLNNNEIFYLFNRVNGGLVEIVKPDAGATLKFKITNKNNDTTLVTSTSISNAIVNFKGETLQGVSSATINVNKFTTSVEDLVIDNKLEANYAWYWSWDVNGVENTKNIIKNRVDFLSSETQNSLDFENLISNIKIDENVLLADDSVSSIKIYFIDTKKEYSAVNLPYNLPSENLGSVFYSVVDVETGKVLIDFDNATKMFFDGEKYVFDFFIPKIYKNSLINFKFKYSDSITSSEKFIYNTKYSTRIL